MPPQRRVGRGRGHATPPGRDRPLYRRQGLVILAVAVLVVGLGIGIPLSQALTSSGSTNPGIINPVNRPQAYQVVYRVQISAGSDQSRSWEVLTVRRPFLAADLTYHQRPGPGVAPASGTLTSEDGLYERDALGLHQVAGRQPGPGTGDVDLLTEMPGLVARHMAVAMGTKTVAGARCGVYRFFEPPAGPIAALGGPTDHDDLCIDGRGLVRSERWTYHGQVVLTRTATEVDLAPRDASALSTAGASPTPVDPRAPRARSAPEAQSFLASPPLPAHFLPAGVFEFILPDPQQQGQLLDTSVVWAFTRGPDVITVEAGMGQLPWQAGDTPVRPVRLARLGPAQTALDSDASEVRVDLGGGRWARVRGTVPLTDLVSYANQLGPAS